MNASIKPQLVHRSWLEQPELKKILAVLNPNKEETRIVGGAVRNALLGEEIGDIDLATTARPEIVKSLGEAAGFKVVPTGVDHGTQTVIVEGVAFEVTTLRSDVRTDGRHAIVAFTRNWKVDAERRDFTMNALSIDHQGEIHDPLNGYDDLVHRRVRFIGDAELRIREDHLRILRFFRFFAYYGTGRPDRDGLKAVVRTKNSIRNLSAERVWHEWKRLLSAPDPERAVLWMRTTEVLNEVLPENWGLDQFHWLLSAEREQGLQPDFMRRLEAMLQPEETIIDRLVKRLKLSNLEAARLHAWVAESGQAKDYAELAVVDFAKVLYRANNEAICDALSHEYAKRLAKEEDGAQRIRALLDFIITWQRPVFPVSGQDLKDRGLSEGRILGNKLLELENDWIESGFSISRDTMLDRLS